MLVGTALETLGVGIVVPALALMTQTDLATRYPEFQPVFNFFGNPSHEWLVIVGMLTLVGIYVIKSVFLALLVWQEKSFAYGVLADLSYRLFVGYLRQPYTFHLQRNSAHLINNIVNESKVLTLSGLIAMMMLSTEIMVLIGISSLLLVMEPVGALVVVSILGLAAWSFSFFSRKHILNWGKSRQYHDGLLIKHLQQGLGGAKDVKLLGRESDFVAQYQQHNIGSTRVGRLESTLKMFPRLLLELLAVSGLAILVIAMVIEGKSLETLIPSIGLFAAAAFRLMPSINRILSAIQNVRYSIPVVDKIHAEIQLLDGAMSPQRSELLTFNHNLSLDDVSFSYPSTQELALRGISLNIPRGNTIGLIGGSGAGKSTLVDIVLGLLTPVSGSIKVDGIDIQTNLRGWQDQIGYVPQSIFLTDDTLRRNIAFGLSDEQIDETAIEKAVDAAQLKLFISELPNGLDTLVGERGITLSGGQRQRIGIARALYHDPQVLVLDEATSSLDTLNEQSVMDAVRALHGNKTILIVAHRLTTVKYCDHLYRLDKGMIVEDGDVDTVLQNDDKEKVNYNPEMSLTQN